jgi:transposase
MSELSIVGLDLAKSVFQAHGAAGDGLVLFRKKLRRDHVAAFFAELPRCRVAMEACASAHYWGRLIRSFGHDVCLIPPAYVKPFVKRQKNDSADAEAIAEAASRAGMRFVALKDAEQQSLAMTFKTRDLLVRQKTQTINALRGHLAEYGVIVPAGPAHVGKLRELVDQPENGLLEQVVGLARLLLAHIDQLQIQISVLDKQMRAQTSSDAAGERLMTIPGIGPVCAGAILALAPPAETFKCGRDFAAWLGLTPKQHSSGGKERLGRVSKMGQRDIRRLLIIGSMAVVRWASKSGARPGSWLEQMLARKPRLVVAVALANKMARTAWALMAHGGIYKDPALAA